MPRRSYAENAITPYRQSLHERILHTAMKQFSQQGVRSVRMDDLANALGISKRTLYELYSNKEDLLFEGVKRYYTLEREESHRIVSGSGNVMDTLLLLYQHSVMKQRKVNPTFYSDLEHYPNIVKYLKRESDKQREERKQFILRGMDEGYFRPDINVELVLQVFEMMQNKTETRDLPHSPYILENGFRRELLQSVIAIIALMIIIGCSNNSRREEIQRRRAALIEKQDTALKNTQERLAIFDQQLQAAEKSYDSLLPIVEQHRNDLTATEDELRRLNRLRQHRDSLRTACEVMGAKIRYIHRRQKENESR